MKKLALILLSLGSLATASFAETIPTKPTRYFNDFAGLVDAGKAIQFNEQLAQFERDTSNQFIVVTYPKMDTDSDVADYTQRIAQSWHVGQKDKNNGLVLFVFMNPRKIYVQVGYGLEGAIPDITAHSIIENVIKPYFKEKNFNEGFEKGINAFIKASAGEYKGNGKTVAEMPRIEIDFSGCITVFWWVLGIGIISSPFVAIFIRRRNKRLRTRASRISS
jgi:uncharacterized protein